MIKSLFDHDEEPQPKENESETETEESIKRQLDELNLLAADAPEPPREPEPIILPETVEQTAPANAAEPPPNYIFSENQFFEVKTGKQSPETETPTTNQTENEIFSQTEAKPLTTAETIRQSGMAWSAAVGLCGSVVFMLILGWFFDVLTGASPLGLVGGIIIGSIIGFYQFFRVTSQIFKKD